MLILSPMKHARQGHRQQNYEYNLKHMMTKSPKGSSPYTWDTCKRQTPCITTDNNMNHSKQEKSGKGKPVPVSRAKLLSFLPHPQKPKADSAYKRCYIFYLFVSYTHDTPNGFWICNLILHPFLLRDEVPFEPKYTGVPKILS